MHWKWLLIVFMVSPPGSLFAQSLWTDQARSFYTDVKARQANDILTILIEENTNSDRTAHTDTKKESNVGATVSRAPTPTLFGSGLERALKKLFKLDFDATSDFKGEGKINRTDKVNATIPARVVKVMDNGVLLVEGRRAVAVNDEVQFLVISGMVRGEDITPDNTVSSNKIADAEIRMEGSGVLAEKQRPGILQRLLDWLWLF